MEHKGIAITFDETRGEFTAYDKSGKLVRKPSLAAMKKALDAADKFEPFNALREADYRDHRTQPDADYIQCRVIGVQKPPGKQSWHNKPQWIIEGDSRRERRVWPDTPETLAALREYNAAIARHREEKDALQERHTAELAAIDADIKPQFPQP